MPKLSETARRKFGDFYFGEISSALFADWLYRASDVEEQLGKDNYCRLIELDYRHFDDFRNRDDIETARAIVRELYDSSDADALYRDKIIEVLKDTIDGRIDPRKGCEILADIYRDGHEDLVPVCFYGFASELNAPGAKKFYYPLILREMRDFLDRLSLK